MELRSLTTTRRGLLVSLIAVSGCLNPSQSESDDTPADETTERERSGTATHSPETTTETRTEKFAQQAQIHISNHMDETHEFEITISSGSNTVFDETVAMQPEDVELVESGITEPGTYDVTVSVTESETESYAWELETADSWLDIELNRTGLHVDSTHSDPTTSARGMLSSRKPAVSA